MLMSAPVHLCFSFSPSVLCKRLPQETETATVCFDSVFLFVFFGWGGGLFNGGDTTHHCSLFHLSSFLFY